MASASPVPWNETPAREFPIKRWLRERYGFDVPTRTISRYPVRPSALPDRFPLRRRGVSPHRPLADW